MNDFGPQAVLQATADVLREQRAELDQVLADKQKHLDEIDRELGKLAEVAGSRAGELKAQMESHRAEVAKQAQQLVSQIQALEAKVAAMPPDAGPAVAKLEGRLDQLERQPGPAGKDGRDGKDADPKVVAEELVVRHADKLRGEKGEPGQSIQGPQGERGPAGETPDPNDVAAKLYERHGQDLRGEPGVAGPEGKAGPGGPKGDPGRQGRRWIQRAIKATRARVDWMD